MSGFLVILLYLVSAAAALHAARREAPRAAFHESALYLAAAALAAHAAWLADTVGPSGPPSLGLADSASLMGLVVGAGGLLAVFAARFRTVAAACFALAALLAAGTGSLAPSREVAQAGWPLNVHVVLAMGAAGMLAIAAIRLLEPFSHRWFYGDSIFIIDLWMWIGLGAAVWLSGKREKAKAPGWTVPARTAIAATLAYIAFNIGLTWHIEAKARDTLLAQGATPTLIVASPKPVAFWRREVLWRDDRQFGRGTFDLFSGLALGPDRQPLGMDDPRIAAAAQKRKDVAAFLFWSRMPFAVPKGGGLTLRDQRFDNPVTRDRFTVHID